MTRFVAGFFFALGVMYLAAWLGGAEDLPLVASLADILNLDWAHTEFPEGFEPLDAIVLVKGVYEIDGDLSRPTWTHRWTMALAKNGSERVGALEVARSLALEEVLSDYVDDE